MSGSGMFDWLMFDSVHNVCIQADSIPPVPTSSLSLPGASDPLTPERVAGNASEIEDWMSSLQVS
jgi:hypothetical protein